MNVKEANNLLISIIEKKQSILGLTYENPEYDKVEDALHDLEDEFIDSYGEELEKIFQSIYDTLDSEDEVFLPTAYIATSYIILKNGNAVTYDVSLSQGFRVETPKYAGQIVTIVLLPNPMRILIQIDKKTREVLWQAE